MDRVFFAKTLNNDQLESFDVDAVDRESWGYVRVNIDRDFPDGRFRLLDIGGGNGAFADRILAAYPRATATVLDSSDMLLGRNRPHERKRLFRSPVECAEAGLDPPYDLISLNVILHHLVTSSYRGTIANIRSTIGMCRRWLSDHGRISILENMYNGRWVDGLANHVIYSLASSSVLAPLARRLGANTAGVGVCFLSTRQWKHLLRGAGLRVQQYAEDSARLLPRLQRILIDEVRTAHLWCVPTDDPG